MINLQDTRAKKLSLFDFEFDYLQSSTNERTH